MAPIQIKWIVICKLIIIIFLSKWGSKSFAETINHDPITKVIRFSNNAQLLFVWGQTGNDTDIITYYSFPKAAPSTTIKGNISCFTIFIFPPNYTYILS